MFDTPKGQVVAADRVSFQIRRGEFVCLLGPSGCGKSTVLNTIAGFETPFEGSVRVAGRPVTAPGPGPRHGVPAAASVSVEVGAQQYFARPAAWRDRSSKQARAIADDLIAMVGLTRFADAYPHTLSGGMQQRVAIARALANRPAVLLMDEPFGALDAQTRAVMQESLLALWAQVGTTIVFVTHDIDEAIFLADRVLLMSAGPGRILRDLRIELPRPRSSELVLSPAYAAYKKDCLDLIRAESLRAFDQQAVK